MRLTDSRPRMTAPGVSCNGPDADLMCPPFQPLEHSEGGVAQPGERCVRNAEVVGSSPIASTTKALSENLSDRAFLLSFNGIRPRHQDLASTRNLPCYSPQHSGFLSFAGNCELIVSSPMFCQSNSASSVSPML